MERSCIRSSKISADDAIKKIRALGLLDTAYHIEQDENYVYIPDIPVTYRELGDKDINEYVHEKSLKEDLIPIYRLYSSLSPTSR